MACGDHVFVHRLGYTHHGIDTGTGTVIHYTGEVGQKANAAVRETPMEDFAKGCPVFVRGYGACEPPAASVERARSRLGEASYHLVFSNCEHFATWCRTGHHRSEQVQDAAAVGGGVAASGAAVAAGLGTISATGAAAGLSGPGIMSGLATVGGAVGGGAVAGIIVVGSAPAALTTVAMMYVLGDDPVLHETERQARRIGRVATLIGGVGGSVASVGTVAAVGTVAGLGGAGITSGLAAVGATVGGGMAAGVAVTAAAPAILAAAVGYGIYRGWKFWRQSRVEGVDF